MRSNQNQFLSSKFSPSHYHNRGQPQQHRPKLKPQYVAKSQLVPPPSDFAAAAAEQAAAPHVDGVGKNHLKDASEPELNPRNVDKKHTEASSSGTKEGDGDDIMGRLDKLLLSEIEEPDDFSEEQIAINDKLQQDELLVVESIYGESVFSLERWKGLRCFQIHICIDVLDEIAITAKMNSSNELKTVGSNSDDFLYSFKVQYLPPIVLTCLLPKSYPSHQPPIFTISVKWLEPVKILNLCSQLDSIWEEQQGQEVIYHWVEWLHGSSLSHLGFDKEITLGPYGVNHVVDKRVVSGTECIDVDIPFLQSYNNEKHHEKFLKELHECCICYSEFPGTEFVQLPCKHFFCRKCMQTFTQIHVKEGTINNLECLEAKCKVMIPPGLLKHLLVDEDYDRWESMILEKTLASMSDVVYCPRCETSCIEDDDKHGQCPKCFFSFCTRCRDRRHVGIACITLEMKLQILRERQKLSQLKEDQKRKELEMINEMRSMEEIHRDSQPCPSCNMAISRIEGCNHMTCSNCGQHFCYRCNKKLDKLNPYEHFGGFSCDVFQPPRAPIPTWQEQLNPRQAAAQIQAEHHEHGKACPNCRQFNAKIGNNNHIFCWACQSHYCYLCNKVVRRNTNHYGPKGCKQHSEG